MEKDYVREATERIQAMVRSYDESGLAEMYGWMDDAWRSKWDLPEQLAELDWIYKSVSSDPHDALRGGTRTLSAVAPKITLHPLLPNRESRERANQIERVLDWEFKLAGRRRKANIIRDMALSALKYDEICTQVIHLPTQVKLVKEWNGNPNRLAAARRYGNYAIVTHNPKNVLVDYSEWMPERVVLRKIFRAHEVVAFWGDRAEELTYLNEKDHHDFVTIYDYTDYDRRIVLAFLQSDDTGYASVSYPDTNALPNTGGVVLMNEKNDMPFLPWAVKVGGNTLDSEEEHQRTPLLYPIYQSGQWEAMNILDTVGLSEVISMIGQMKYVVEGPTGYVDVDYDDPKRVGHVPPGHKLEQMPPPIYNDAVQQMYDRFQGRVDKSTISRILLGDVPGGTAFATLSLQTQSAMKSLTPYKELTQDVLADVFAIMLNWVHYSNKPLVAYVPREEHFPEGIDGRTRAVVSEEISVTPDDFDPEHLYIDVKLTEDVPDDELQRINAASIMVQTLNLPRVEAMARVGLTDPELMMKLRNQEDINLATVQAQASMIMAKVELEVEKARMALQMEAQMAQQQMAMAAQAGAQQGAPGPQRFDPRAAARQLPAGPGDPNLQRPAGGMGFENMGGNGNNPAMGGSPPAMGNPSGTRETQQGLRTG